MDANTGSLGVTDRPSDRIASERAGGRKRMTPAPSTRLGAVSAAPAPRRPALGSVTRCPAPPADPWTDPAAPAALTAPVAPSIEPEASVPAEAPKAPDSPADRLPLDTEPTSAPRMFRLALAGSVAAVAIAIAAARPLVPSPPIPEPAKLDAPASPEARRAPIRPVPLAAGVVPRPIAARPVPPEALTAAESASIPPLTASVAGAIEADDPPPPRVRSEVPIHRVAVRDLLVSRLKGRAVEPTRPPDAPPAESKRSTPAPQAIAKAPDPPLPFAAPPPPFAPAASDAKAATIVVLMPSVRAELLIRGGIGEAKPEEWVGPRRVFRTPPIAGEVAYSVGAFWTDVSRKRQTRATKLTVRPGETYEVDLRGKTPAWRTVGTEGGSPKS